jgi:2-succinyl-5-enolpyruvyl-6-hydroxy-3-cyclohexene-1-carboxylate synthase
MAVVTHPAICDPQSSIEEALDQVDAWLESPTLSLVAERSDH